MQTVSSQELRVSILRLSETAWSARARRFCKLKATFFVTTFKKTRLELDKNLGRPHPGHGQDRVRPRPGRERQAGPGGAPGRVLHGQPGEKSPQLLILCLSLTRAHVRTNVQKHKFTCTSFDPHDSSHNLTPDLPHPCDFSARGWDIRCSKRCFLGFDTFPGIFG